MTQKKACAGMIDLWFLDQSGFCDLPTGYGWGRLGRRLVVRHEAPRVGGSTSWGRSRRMARRDRGSSTRPGARPRGATTRRPTWPSFAVWQGSCRHPAGAPVRGRAGQLFGPSQPSGERRRPAWAASGVHFCFLPAYSPELNPIEPVWRQVKYRDIPERGHPTDTALQAAVETALADRARRLAQPTINLPRPA